MTTINVNRELSSFRFAETFRGDTMQRIALRELGDASRWPEIVSYNNLIPPFITDDEVLAGNGVLLSGDALRIPAPVRVVDASIDPSATFLVDIDLSTGLIESDGVGDVLLCAGVPNLKQAIKHRIETTRSDLMYHPEYGSLIKRLIGTVTGPTANILAAEYAKSAVEADPRIQAVSSSTAQIVGDAISVSVEAETISGRVVSINEEF